MTTLPAQPNQSLLDGLAVLQALASAGHPLSCARLARELGLEVTRVNRLVKTLAYLGLAHQTARGQYTTGAGMHVLAAQSLFGSGLMRAAGATLESLTAYNHLVAFGMLWRDMVAYLFHWSPGLSITEAIGRSALFPATKSSIGLALLAQQPEEAVAALFADRPTPGFTDLAALRQALAAIRAQGFAQIPAEGGKGQVNIAVVIGAPAYAALAITGLPPEDAPTMLTILRQAAVDIDAACNQTKGSSR